MFKEADANPIGFALNERRGRLRPPPTPPQGFAPSAADLRRGGGADPLRALPRLQDGRSAHRLLRAGSPPPAGAGEREGAEPPRPRGDVLLQALLVEEHRAIGGAEKTRLPPRLSRFPVRSCAAAGWVGRQELTPCPGGGDVWLRAADGGDANIPLLIAGRKAGGPAVVRASAVLRLPRFGRAT